MSLLKKVYELLAQQVIDDYAITEGRCLDIGSGQGAFGLEIAKRSALQIIMLDIKQEVLVKAEANSKKLGLMNRTLVIKAPVEDLPFIDDYFDLIVSRGSIFFWNDRARGLKEIYRVLKPGGVAFVGGGTSRFMSLEEIEDFFRWARPVHEKACQDWEKIRSPEYMQQILDQAEIDNYNLTTSAGNWIEIKK